MEMKAIGSYAFMIGIILALITGLVVAANVITDVNTVGMISAVLVLLGAVVGFLNISGKEATSFLIAAIAFLVAGAAGLVFMAIPLVGTYLAAVLGYMGVFVAPAAVIVGLKEIMSLAK